MDIKQTIADIAEKIKGDKNLAAKFEKDPVKTLEELFGIDLPDDQLNSLITAIKAKLGSDEVADKLGKLGGMFGLK